MRRNLLYTALCASSLLVITACSDDVVVQENNDTGKTPIELSVGGINEEGFTSRSVAEKVSRAVITDGDGKTKRAFTGATNLFFAVKAEHKDGITAEKPAKWGYNYATAAAVSNPDVNSKSNMSFHDNYLYWDDAYARDTKVSIYSIAMANKESTDDVSIGSEGKNSGQFGVNTSKIAFTSDEKDLKTTWSVGQQGSSASVGIQNSTSFADNDLVFSNNLTNNTGADKRLYYHTETGEKYHKFDKGELIYYHALTKFTIKIKAGDGFTATSSSNDFKFTNSPSGTDNSFCLNGFYGNLCKFDIEKGEFYDLGDGNKRTYTSIYLAKTTRQPATSGDFYTLNAYVVPGTDMTNISGPTNAFSFIIDGNKYDISLAQLYNALQNGTTNGTANVIANILDDSKKLKAGYNYEFTFTVEKSKISGLTAQAVDWETVTADNITPSNARISLKLEERGSDYVGSNVDFYRAVDTDNNSVTDTYDGYNWTKGYEKNYTSKSYDETTHKWTFSNWFWPDNTTFYHFRAVGDKSSSSAAAPTVTADATNGDNFTLAAGESYHDYIWGAPMLDDDDNETDGSFKFYYNATNGFDATGEGTPNANHQIYKGIGPTNATVKLLMFHMMSNVTFKVKTTTGTDAVELTKNSNKVSITLKNIHKAGKVLLGNGLVSGTDTKSDYQFTTTPATTAATPGVSEIQTWANYGAIPQSLQDVVLVITTPDNNRYEVAMKDVIGTVSETNIKNPYTASSTSGKYQINAWYPGFKYEYTFTLSKKKVESITATILDWETVTAGDDNVQIK